MKKIDKVAICLVVLMLCVSSVAFALLDTIRNNSPEQDQNQGQAQGQLQGQAQGQLQGQLQGQAALARHLIGAFRAGAAGIRGQLAACAR